MTMVVPCRLMTRQRSHMGLTDGRTFIMSAFSSEISRTAKPHATGNQCSRAAPAFVRIFGPPAVIATVCSKCAARLSSTEEIDQSSS
jgi:hypothetical protein